MTGLPPAGSFLSPCEREESNPLSVRREKGSLAAFRSWYQAGFSVSKRANIKLTPAWTDLGVFAYINQRAPSPADRKARDGEPVKREWGSPRASGLDSRFHGRSPQARAAWSAEGQRSGVDCPDSRSGRDHSECGCGSAAGSIAPALPAVRCGSFMASSISMHIRDVVEFRPLRSSENRRRSLIMDWRRFFGEPRPVGFSFKNRAENFDDGFAGEG